MGPSVVDMAWTMAIAMVGSFPHSQAVCTDIGSSCLGLHRPVPRPTGGIYRWVLAVVVVLDWVGSILGPRRSNHVLDGA